MKVIGIIPARYASSRFPGKPLADILGKPMIQWVYERSKTAKLLDELVVATDDKRIFDAVSSFGGKAAMTSPNCKNGTERVAEVIQNFDCSLVVNIQGDEPIISPKTIDQLIDLMRNNLDAPVGTLVKKIRYFQDLKNPNIPKVIVDNNFNAIYFSRTVIPYFRDEANFEKWIEKAVYYKHIGIYIYRRDFLLKFVNMPISNLEKIEQLEQLRILENSFKIKVAETESESIGVDTPADIERVIKFLNGRTN
jgi:3-deoxy-manno-octulosonate cytidylyltransferase (CMP-KDO synthetase)